MTIIITIIILILAYLFAVGAKAMVEQNRHEIELVLISGIRHYIFLVLLVCAPIVIWNGWKVCAWRVKTWRANMILKRKAARLFKAVSKRNKDNPELQKDLEELDDLFKKL